MKERGYTVSCLEQCIIQLIARLKDNRELPHEIALFLGHPPEDVQGFIQNRSDCAKCVGCWKVYGNEEKVQELFQKYYKCTAIYLDQWSKGKSMERLAVAD